MNMESKLLRTLVVVEPFYRDQLKELLNKQYPNMMVSMAENGEQALKVVSLFRPHLIFLDIPLLGNMGLSIVRNMRQLGSEAKIVLLNSYDLPEYRNATEECGANYFMPKDTSTGADVLTLVEQVISDPQFHTS